MNQPVAVVAPGVVLAGVRAAALGSVERGVQRHRRLADHVVEFEGVDEIGVPDQRPVGDREIGDAVVDRGQLPQPCR
jgi:hypothetical protein